jgi:uncharacterized protein (TIGR03000 family)
VFASGLGSSLSNQQLERDSKMMTIRWSTIAGASLSAVVLAVAGPGSAMANSWGSHGSSGGSHGSSGGSHGSSGGSHGGLFSHSSHGSSGGGSHGSSGGSHGGSFGGLFSHGSHGSSGGGSHGSSGGGSHGSSGGSGGGYYTASYSAPGSGYYMVSTPAEAPRSAVAYLSLNVPADAKVYLQDQLMTLDGAQRRFVTPELAYGNQHVYTVKVEVVRDGQTITKTTEAQISAGQEIQVSVTPDGQNPKELVASVALLASR